MSVLPGQLSLDLEATAASPPPEQQDDSGRSGSKRRSQAGMATEDVTTGQELLRVSDVSRITGLSTNAVYRAIWSGELQASKLRGQLRVQAADVKAWVVAGRVTGTRTVQEPPPRARGPRTASPGRGLRELLEAGTPPP
jgi:excisionase family DNA binding protein